MPALTDQLSGFVPCSCGGLYGSSCPICRGCELMPEHLELPVHVRRQDCEPFVEGDFIDAWAATTNSEACRDACAVHGRSGNLCEVHSQLIGILIRQTMDATGCEPGG